jgi:hypothetical protein
LCNNDFKRPCLEIQREKFSGKNIFALWKLKMRYLLVQKGLKRELARKTKKPTSMKDED